MNVTIARATTAALALALSTVAGLAAADEGFDRSQAPAHLEGTWAMRITPYVCGSDPIVSFPEFTVTSLLTFGAGGTLVETTSSPRFAPGQRSPGHGYWERTGRTTYSAVIEAFIQFAAAPPSPYVRGTQRIEQEVVLADSDHWTSVAVVTFRDETGTKVPPSGCATAAATRLE